MAKLPSIVQPLPLTRLAYERLRESILTGHMHSGEIYNEMALAKELGVSRTPVREALLELASQGLVTFLPRKGVQVNYFTERDAEEVFELRRVIELAAVEKSAEHYQSVDFKPLEKALVENEKAALKRDSRAFLRADRTFHVRLAELYQNRRMISILDNLRDIIHLMSVEALSRPDRMEEVVGEHRQILDHLRAGESDAAREAMSQHLTSSQRAVMEQHRRGRAPSADES